jgi:hypothetical protein
MWHRASDGQFLEKVEIEAESMEDAYGKAWDQDESKQRGCYAKVVKKLTK